MNRRHFLSSSLVGGISTALLWSGKRAWAGTEPNDESSGFRVVLESPAKRFDGKQSYAHPMAGIVPGAGRGSLPRIVMTLMTIELSGNDVFKAMYGLSTDDLGKTWSAVRKVPQLSFRMEEISGQRRPVACGGFGPTWHKASKTLLGTGHTVAYTPEWKVVNPRPRSSAYAYYNPESNSWNPWQLLSMPEGPKFHNAGAGCTQRYDLPDGTILLPVYFKTQNRGAGTTIVRCSFDGQELKYREHGQELDTPDTSTRGLGEPSLTKFGDLFFLTLRNDKRGYVTRGKDGLHFEPIRPWTFENGQELGSYNTQQHWVTHSEGLFLVYTRRGLNNDHVFRHRAPLVIARVDPERLCVLRSTERELAPNRGARLGNFGVTAISPHETWVTVAEWMQPKGVEKYGSDGSVWVSRIHWNRPNLLFDC
ncbi:MAG: exo-alpha-sialidase [Pirellulales bacterium]|nr:exo-alpha-sialidase [Pirellulales bacterium]